MRILHIIDMLSSGGKERRLLELLKFFEKKFKNEIESRLIVLSKDIYYEEINDLDVKLVCIDRKKTGVLKTYSEISKEYNEFNPDIVHSWGAVPSCFISVLKIFRSFRFVNAMAASAPEKIIFTKTWFFAKFSYLFSDRIVSNSKAGLIAFGAPFKKSKVIYNGFSAERLHKIRDTDIVRNELGISDKKVVGMVATFSEKKDWDTFLISAEEILTKRNDVIFLCIGDGRNFIRYKSKYKDPQIIFTGNRKDVESVVNIFDIGVLCTYGESLSNSILEYMALGKPVIATDKGGNKEIIEHGISGCLFKHKDLNDYKEKLLTLLFDKDLRYRMGKRSKEIVAEKFSIENMAGKTYELYREMLR